MEHGGMCAVGELGFYTADIDVYGDWERERERDRERGGERERERNAGHVRAKTTLRPASGAAHRYRAPVRRAFHTSSLTAVSLPCHP